MPPSGALRKRLNITRDYLHFQNVHLLVSHMLLQGRNRLAIKRRKPMTPRYAPVVAKPLVRGDACLLQRSRASITQTREFVLGTVGADVNRHEEALTRIAVLVSNEGGLRPYGPVAPAS